MPKKRRNGGRGKKNRGHTRGVPCTHCGRIAPKDKAVKRYTVRNIVDASSLRDIKDSKAYETFSIPKLYTKLSYCISCAIHLRVVRVRNHEVRRQRAPPQRVQRKEREEETKTIT